MQHTTSLDGSLPLCGINGQCGTNSGHGIATEWKQRAGNGKECNEDGGRYQNHWLRFNYLSTLGTPISLIVLSHLVRTTDGTYPVKRRRQSLLLSILLPFIVMS